MPDIYEKQKQRYKSIRDALDEVNSIPEALEALTDYKVKFNHLVGEQGSNSTTQYRFYNDMSDGIIFEVRKNGSRVDTVSYRIFRLDNQHIFETEDLSTGNYGGQTFLEDID